MWFAVLYRLCRTLARDQGRPVPSNLPLSRLLLGEVALLARRIGRWRVAGVALLVAALTFAVETALSESTPGPVVAAPWRSLVAALTGVLAVVIWSVAHAAQRTRAQRKDQPR